jgi:hypothetical protein
MRTKGRPIEMFDIVADVEAIATLYASAALLTRTTGRSHVVDHIVPLKGRTRKSNQRRMPIGS